MWKKILLLVIVLALAAVGGVTVYLNNIDWNRHKDEISRQFSQATGKEVVFEGPVRFSLFPSPYLEAADISVYNQKEKGERVLLAKIPRLVSTLSIRSLISGHFNVERMNIMEPEIFVEAYPEGGLNWQSAGGDQQDFQIDNVEISLNSVTIEKAKMHLVNRAYNINSLLDNMNAEVIAQSLFGPYRIEGSYVKNGNPGGFAISLGQFSGSFATSVNAVISHPQSESYVRFDGTVLLSNDAVNGNLIFESQNPVNFFNTNFKDVKISEDYEQPVALSMELKTDKSQISLGNIVVKYGGTAGAGNILIPRHEEKIGDDGMERRRIDAVFNMTDFELEPALHLLRDFVAKYDRKENYYPEYDFDVIADLKALKTTYNGQVVRDFSLSVDFMDNVLKIQNLSATMPGDASAKLTGEVFAVEKEMTYNFNLTSSMGDFAKFADWLKIDLRPAAQGVYKKASFSAVMEGNTKTIKIAPFDLIMDKSVINGKIGVVRGDKTRWFVIVDGDNINLDNYIPPLPPEVVGRDWREKLRYRFGRLSFLKDVDVQYRASLKTGIYEKVPFENFEMEADVRNSAMQIKEMAVDSVATGDFSFNGEIAGFGGEPQLKNMQYRAEVRNVASFLDKFGITVKDVNFNELSSFSGSGVVTGGLDRFATKSVLRLGNIDAAYHGEAAWNKNRYFLNGKTEIKTPDFVRMLNNFAVDYSPNYPLGLFRMSAGIRTNGNLVSLENLNANIGVNNFRGNLIYQLKNGRRQVKSNLQVNRFELEKFFYNISGRDDKTNFRNSAETATFLVRPRLSQMLINYAWLNNWDANITFSVGTLMLNNMSLTNTAGRLLLNEGIMQLAGFSGVLKEGKLSGEATLNMTQGNRLGGKLSLDGMKISKDGWSGNVYGLTEGRFSVNATFETSAASVESLLNDFSGSMKFSVADAVVKGWNFERIIKDLQKRDTSDGFAVVARDALGQGETFFDSIAGEAFVNHGVYELSNVQIDNNALAIDMVADGSLKDWTNDASLKVAFYEGRVPGFDFSYTGSLNTPVLNVDVSRVTGVYDAHWAKMEADAKAAEQARIDKYLGLMQQQQQAARATERQLEEEIVPDFDAFSKLAEDAGTRRQYQETGRNIEALRALLEEIFAKENMANVDDDVIARLEGQNKQAKKQAADIDAEVQRIHLKDVKLRVAASSKAVYDSYEEAKKIPLDYIDKLGGMEKRLASINTDFLPRMDKKVVGLQDDIEAGLAALDTLNSEIAKDNVTLQNVKDTVRLEMFADRFAKMEEEAMTTLSGMKKATADMLAYVEGRVSAEEEAFNKLKREQEIRRKMKENTGQLTAGGKTVTVGRNLDEIRRAEEAVKEQKIRVLDFSDSGRGAAGRDDDGTGADGIIVKQ